MPFSVTIHFIQLCQDILQLIGDRQPQMSGILQHGHTFIGQIEENDCGSQHPTLAKDIDIHNVADAHEGVVNGAMLYDRGQLKPLFQLSIGQAGSSFAVEIARQIGLPEQIIQRATEIVGEEHIDYDKHLQDIARDKRYWENKRQNIRQKEKHLEEKIAHYEEQMAGIKAKKRAIIEEANAEAADLLRKSNATIERTIREIKEAKAEKKATQAARQKVETLKTKVENQASKSSKSSTTSAASATSTAIEFS